MSTTRKMIKKPDASVRDIKLEILNKQKKIVDTELESLKQQINKLQIESSNDERTKLQNRLKEIIKTQSDFKSKRQQIHDAIKTTDAGLKRKASEISDKTGKAKYKSIAEIEARVAQLDAEIGSGELKLVEEKLRVKEMTSLKKLIKDFKSVEPLQQSIDNDKAKIASLKEELTKLNSKEISAEFEETQAKLNSLKEASQSVYDKRGVLFGKRDVLFKKRDEIFKQIRATYDDFDAEFKAFKVKLEAEKLRRLEDEKLSVLQEERAEKEEKLQAALIDARVPAFTHELDTIDGLLAHFDDSYVKPVKNTIVAPALAKTAPVAIRQVQADDLVPVEKKSDEGFFAATKVKGKKGKKTKVAPKHALDPAMIQSLGALDIAPPLSPEDIPAVIEQLKKKHEEYESIQEETTEKNIEQAESKLEALRKEYDEKEAQVKKELEEKANKEKAEQEEN